LIYPDGHIEGAVIGNGETLRIWDYDGDIPILVSDLMTMESDATLRMVFEDATWGSTIMFEPDIDILLNGTLELLLDEDALVNSHILVGTTFGLFDWEGANRIGEFIYIHTQPGLIWDTSRLYTTGEIALSEVPEPMSIVLLSLGGCMAMRSRTRRRNLVI